MNHLDDDALLKRALKLLEEDDRSKQDRHISGCCLCQVRFENVKSESELIGSLKPEIDLPAIPLPRTRMIPVLSLVKIAALLIIGFIAGYSISESSRAAVVTVIPHRVSYSAEQQSMSGFTVCDQG